jgi:hypothetical protein
VNQDEIRDMETMLREFDAFEKMYKRGPVTGGADIERKYQYWIDLGASRAEERIIKLLEALKEPDMKFHKFSTLMNVDNIIALIKGETYSVVNDQVDVQEIWSNTLGSGWEYSEWFIGIKYDGGDWSEPCNAKLRHFSRNDEDVIVTTDFTPEMLVEAHNKLVREKYTHCGGCGMDDPDACTSDAVLQYMVYGDLIYG